MHEKDQIKAENNNKKVTLLEQQYRHTRDDPTKHQRQIILMCGRNYNKAMGRCSFCLLKYFYGVQFLMELKWKEYETFFSYYCCLA